MGESPKQGSKSSLELILKTLSLPIKRYIVFYFILNIISYIKTMLQIDHLVLSAKTLGQGK